MTDLRDVEAPSAARARWRSRPGRVSPPMARAPTLRKERRLTPSQVRGPRPMKSSMAYPPASHPLQRVSLLLSMIEHELLRVQDHPQHVFQPLLLARRLLDVGD